MSTDEAMVPDFYDEGANDLFMANDLSKDRGLEREWKRIAGTQWTISNYGAVRNTEGPASISLTITGRPRVRITVKGRRQWRYLNSLVLETFVERRPHEDMIPWHRDGDLGNCRVDNLVWVQVRSREE